MHTLYLSYINYVILQIKLILFYSELSELTKAINHTVVVVVVQLLSCV